MTNRMRRPIFIAITVVLSLFALMFGQVCMDAKAEDTAAATLALACEGTVADKIKLDAKPEPISMGIIVDFAARTVEGFSLIRAKIIEVTETSVSFRGSDDTHGSVIGGIDRVTGAVEAFTSLAKLTTSYSLKCRPTQRMF